LTRGAGAREPFLDELNRFFDGLEQAVMTGNPSGSIRPFMNGPARHPLGVTAKPAECFANTEQHHRHYERYRYRNLSEQDALDLLCTITPIYTYGLEKIARLEMEARVAYITKELVK